MTARETGGARCARGGRHRRAMKTAMRQGDSRANVIVTDLAAGLCSPAERALTWGVKGVMVNCRQATIVVEVLGGSMSAAHVTDARASVRSRTGAVPPRVGGGAS